MGSVIGGGLRAGSNHYSLVRSLFPTLQLEPDYDDESRESIDDLSIDLKSNEISKTSKKEISKKFNEVFDDKNGFDENGIDKDRFDESGDDVLTSFGSK